MNIFVGFIAGIVALISGFSGSALYQHFFTGNSAPSATVGGIKFVGALPTTLSGSGITSSSASISVVSLKITQTGQVLSMSDFGSLGYATLEPGVASRQEFISFTGITQNANGSAILTGVTRGLSPVYPYTASSSVAFSHGGGTKLIISNSPPFYNEASFKQNNEAVTGLWTFDSQLPTSVLLATQTNQFVTQAYVIGSVLSGAATATQSVTGISRLASAAQTASSTASTANTPYVIQAQTATDTPNTLTRATRVLMSDMTGYLKQGWINLTEAFTFSGPVTFSGTTTFTGISSGIKDSLLLVSSTTLTGATSPQPVFVATSTRSLVLSSNSGTTTNFIGFAIQNATNGSTSTVQLSGVVPGFSGLTPFSDYYITGTGTIGLITATKGFGQYVGKALSTTELLIDKSSVPQLIGSSTFQTTGGSFQTSASCVSTTTIPLHTKQIELFYDVLKDEALDYNMRGSMTLQVNSMDEKGAFPSTVTSYQPGYNVSFVSGLSSSFLISVHGYIDVATGYLRFDAVTSSGGAFPYCVGYAYFYR
jgi:hypothetical protein